MTPNSHTSAHRITTTVAPFRAWRSSQFIAARGPKWVTIAARMLAESLGDCERIQCSTEAFLRSPARGSKRLFFAERFACATTTAPIR